jgi:hypothetical protein
MDIETSHLEQYKMLREEVMQCMREIYTIQVGAAIAAASVYAWLALHKNDVPSRAAWFIAPCVIIVGSLRSAELTLRIRGIAGYLSQIEDVMWTDCAKLPGWEHYKHTQPWIDISSNISAIVIWVLEFVGSIGASLLLSR